MPTFKNSQHPAARVSSFLIGCGLGVHGAIAQLPFQPVADLHARVLPGGAAIGSAPAGLAAVDGRVCFVAAGLSGGVEPFVASANPIGATSLGDLRAGVLGSVASSFVALRGAIFFVADDGLNGAQLWRSDGTSQGTVRVTAISGGVVGADLVAFGERLYFAAREAASGVELWSSDGTMAGTTRVADIQLGSGSSNPSGFVASGSRLYFLADDGVNGRELWMSDGTAAGTVLVGPLAPPGLSSVATPVAARIDQNDGALTVVTLFVGTTNTPAGSQLWFSASSGPPVLLVTLTVGELVLDLLPLEPGILMATTQGALAVGTRLWLVPGQPGSRTLIANLAQDLPRTTFGKLVGRRSRAFFAFGDPQHGTRLWTTDLTPDGTRAVTDFLPRFARLDPSDLTLTPDGLYFSAYTDDTGVELFRADPCGLSITLAADIYPGPVGSDPQELTLVGNTLFFRATGVSGGQELWAATLRDPVACAPDFNHDGLLNADDLGEFIAAYFATAPASAVDFNHDCEINADDLGDYITAYFAGC